MPLDPQFSTQTMYLEPAISGFSLSSCSLLFCCCCSSSSSTHLHSAMPVAHGGVLQDLVARDAHKKQQLLFALPAKNWTITERQLCDIELIINGGFSSLDGFLNDDDYLSVVNISRLANGLLWTIPITLDVHQQFASTTAVGDRIALLQDNSTPNCCLDRPKHIPT